MPKFSDVGKKKKGKSKSKMVQFPAGSRSDGVKSTAAKTVKRCPPPRKETRRQDDAIRRLGVDAEDLRRCPKITDSLQLAFKTVKAAIEVTRFSDETTAIEFFRVYDEIPAGDRDYIPIEAVCLKADITPSALLGTMFMATKALKGHESAMIAVNAFPDVVASMVKFAKEPGGERDRKMLAESAVIGFLPTPKGVSMSVNLMGGGIPQLQNPSKAPAIDAETEEDFRELFPAIGADLEEWSADRRKMLQAEN